MELQPSKHQARWFTFDLLRAESENSVPIGLANGGVDCRPWDAPEGGGVALLPTKEAVPVWYLLWS